jgi:hypothetical protein
MGGTMRLGSYPAGAGPRGVGWSAEAYARNRDLRAGTAPYEVNNAYRDQLRQGRPGFSGTSPDGRLVEFIELDRDRTRSSWPPRRTRAEEPADPAAPAVRGVRRPPSSTRAGELRSARSARCTAS